MKLSTHDDLRNILTFILAGGRGSRLKELTDWRVKPAVPFGGKYRIIDFVLSNCVNSDLRKIEILTQYKSQSLIRHIFRGWELFHPELNEFIECIPAQKKIGSDWYSGTANAIYQNMDLIHFHEPSHILVLAGDHIYKMNYRRLIDFHLKNNAQITIATTFAKCEEASRYGVLQTDETNRIYSFSEKPENPIPDPLKPGYSRISMGIYFMDAEILQELLRKDARISHSSHDFGKDIIPEALSEYRMFAYPFLNEDTGEPEYWKDVGTIDSYWEASMDLVGISPELNLYDKCWPIRTAPGNQPPAKFIFNDDYRQGSAVDSIVAEGSIISGARVEHSLISGNVTIEQQSLIRNSIVLPNVKIGSRCRIVNSIIDKECVIPDDTIIGENAQDDESRFDRSEGGITLVEPEMLGQYVHQIE